eukprot:COSAG03_NODE_9578_length_708_cov_37.190476_1_plen_60_part_01
MARTDGETERAPRLADPPVGARRVLASGLLLAVLPHPAARAGALALEDAPEEVQPLRYST